MLQCVHSATVLVTIVISLRNYAHVLISILCVGEGSRHFNAISKSTRLFSIDRINATLEEVLTSHYSKVINKEAKHRITV